MPFWKKDPVKKDLYTNVAEGLRQVYKSKLLPLEDSDFSAKPMVLLVGQYSVGKTTFIRYLLNVKHILLSYFVLIHFSTDSRKTFRAFVSDQVNP